LHRHELRAILFLSQLRLAEYPLSNLLPLVRTGTSGSFSLKLLAALIAMKTPSFDDLKLWLKWLVFNDCSKQMKESLEGPISELNAFDDKFDLANVHVDKLLAQSESLYKESVDGFKTVNERLDRTLAVALLACGWSVKEVSSPVAYVFFFLSAGTLLAGRINLETSAPIDFMTLGQTSTTIFKQSNSDITMDFVIARQFAKSKLENDFMTQCTQWRIAFSTLLFAVGLLFLVRYN
jgi:hypothetical protein